MEGNSGKRIRRWAVCAAVLAAGTVVGTSASASVTGETYSCGESYWAGGREHALLRVKGELTVCLKEAEEEPVLGKSKQEQRP